MFSLYAKIDLNLSQFVSMALTKSQLFMLTNCLINQTKCVGNQLVKLDQSSNVYGLYLVDFDLLI